MVSCIVYHSIIEFVCVCYMATYSSIWSMPISFVSLFGYVFLLGILVIFRKKYFSIICMLCIVMGGRIVLLPPSLFSSFTKEVYNDCAFVGMHT